MSNELVSARCLSSRLVCAGENPHLADVRPLYARAQPRSARPSRWQSNFAAVFRAKAQRAAWSPGS